MGRRPPLAMCAGFRRPIKSHVLSTPPRTSRPFGPARRNVLPCRRLLPSALATVVLSIYVPLCVRGRCCWACRRPGLLVHRSEVARHALGRAYGQHGPGGRSGDGSKGSAAHQHVAKTIGKCTTRAKVHYSCLSKHAVLPHSHSPLSPEPRPWPCYWS